MKIAVCGEVTDEGPCSGTLFYIRAFGRVASCHRCKGIAFCVVKDTRGDSVQCVKCDMRSRIRDLFGRPVTRVAMECVQCEGHVHTYRSLVKSLPVKFKIVGG